MSDLQELADELMQDPEFIKEYEAMQPEMNITRAILDARANAGMTQMELSQKSGISQTDMRRLEKGTRNPSLNLLKRLAEAMDSTLSIEIIPNKKVENLPMWEKSIHQMDKEQMERLKKKAKAGKLMLDE